MNMNREQLQDLYIRADIEAMDLDDMYTILYDLLEEKISKISDAELLEDVKEYHPDLLEELTTKEIDDKLGYETYSKWQTKNIKSSHLIIIASGVFAPSPLLSGNSTSELVIVTWPNLSTLWLIRFVKSSTSPTPINITNVNNSHWVLSWSDTGDKIATYDNQFKAYQIRRYLACLLNKSASRFHPSPTD